MNDFSRIIIQLFQNKSSQVVRIIIIINLISVNGYLCFPQTIHSPKGASPLSKVISNQSITTNTFAVVVGISDYQDNGIPDLRFADRDAMAFSEWLKSNGGGNLSDDHIKLLTNDNATRAQIGASLDWLMDNCKEGDYAVIYFSGHGDVETKTKSNLGFLLCYDSPSNNYSAGAFHLSYLQAVINTLSENKVKTIIIADACHSGKLAGSSIGGSQATAASLIKQFDNEIKILSCQQNEYSIEGEQWGGGRGVFSFYLTEGLYGKADANADGVVDLMELERYLQDRVRNDVVPSKQIPMVSGDRSERIAKVDLESLALHEQKSKSDKRILAFQDVRGIEKETLSKVDSVTRKNYFDFISALATKNFFCNENSPNIHCADTLFKKLVLIDKLEPLHAYMRRNFAATLQDVVQQALNALLADDPYEYNNWYINPEKYSEYPKYCARAIDLIGKDHYSYSLLYSQQKYFEAYLLLKILIPGEVNIQKQDSLRLKVKSLLMEAISYSPNAAYIYHAIGALYHNVHDYSTDSMIKYGNKAIELSPNWLVPYHDLVEEYLYVNGNPINAEQLITKALKYKPESYLLNMLYSWIMQQLYKFEEADSICLKLIKMKPKLWNAWYTMAVTHFMQSDWDWVIEYSKKSIEVEPSIRN